MSNKNRDIFYGVVAVATLIVALIGATLAYFSISAGSKENAVNAKAAMVSISYNDGQQVSAQADKLIPASDTVVRSVYEKRQENFAGEGETADNNVCIDDNNQQVCSIYRFTVSSDLERTITATLNNESNGFSYLSYAVRDVTNNTWLALNSAGDLSLNLTACDNEDEDESNNCYTLDSSTSKKNYSTTPRAINSIFGYSGDPTPKLLTKTVASTPQIYDLVIFLKENNQNQNVDQGKEYRGTIIVDVTDGASSGQITGYVSE